MNFESISAFVMMTKNYRLRFNHNQPTLAASPILPHRKEYFH